MSLFRSNTGRQYTSLMPSVFVGTAATSPVPFRNLDAMWTKLDELRSNRTPAIDVTNAKQSGPSTTHSGSTSTSQHASATPSPSAVVPISAPHSNHTAQNTTTDHGSLRPSSLLVRSRSHNPRMLSQVAFPAGPSRRKLGRRYTKSPHRSVRRTPLSGLVALTLTSEQISSAAVKTSV